MPSQSHETENVRRGKEGFAQAGFAGHPAHKTAPTGLLVRKGGLHAVPGLLGFYKQGTCCTTRDITLGKGYPCGDKSWGDGDGNERPR